LVSCAVSDSTVVWFGDVNGNAARSAKCEVRGAKCAKRQSSEQIEKGSDQAMSQAAGKPKKGVCLQVAFVV